MYKCVYDLPILLGSTFEIMHVDVLELSVLGYNEIPCEHSCLMHTVGLFRWGQVFILDALSRYKAADAREAENIVERVTPRLQHANCAVVLSAVKVFMYSYLSTTFPCISIYNLSVYSVLYFKHVLLTIVL